MVGFVGWYRYGKKGGISSVSFRFVCSAIGTCVLCLSCIVVSVLPREVIQSDYCTKNYLRYIIETLPPLKYKQEFTDVDRIELRAMT